MLAVLFHGYPVWLGGRKNYNHVWEWHKRGTKTPIEYSDWYERQPDIFHGGHACLRVYGHSYDTNVKEQVQWDDAPCARKEFFICETYPNA
ncbi:hypothetical protein EB796_015390 [Bugula neritina]|uniref:C-type lectin domain-containing protein n=1 Tax=Bugula neritina TaxID=10212 RepID=A0A7J7JKF7_BUGNE|nr:hypothetical protein EB796_015390 [Bugula neritina]